MESHKKDIEANRTSTKAPSKNPGAMAGFVAVSQPRSGQGRMLSSL